MFNLLCFFYIRILKYNCKIIVILFTLFPIYGFANNSGWMGQFDGSSEIYGPYKTLQNCKKKMNNVVSLSTYVEFKCATHCRTESIDTCKKAMRFSFFNTGDKHLMSNPTNPD